MPDVTYLSARRPLPAPRVIRQKEWPNWLVELLAWPLALGIVFGLCQLAALGVRGVIAIVIWLHHIAELAIQ